jgi:hypothetical protein
MRTICPSSSLRRGVGRFTWRTHRIWRWFWSDAASTLHRIGSDGSTKEVFVAGKKPNRFHYSHTQPRGQLSTVCLVQPTLEGDHWRLLSTAQLSVDALEPTTLFDVLKLMGKQLAVGQYECVRQDRLDTPLNKQMYASGSDRRFIH